MINDAFVGCVKRTKCAGFVTKPASLKACRCERGTQNMLNILKWEGEPVGAGPALLGIANILGIREKNAKFGFTHFSIISLELTVLKCYRCT